MSRAWSGALVVAAALLPGTAASQARPPATPGSPNDAIVSALRTHDVVTLSDPHGRVQMQAFLMGLLQDPRLPGLLNDIVIEAGSARYQDALDRFVRGDDVPEEQVRGVWEDTTQPQATGAQARELIVAVRSVNRALPPERRLRVVAGDPPIDWTHVTSRQDHWRWIELRDSYPADLIRRQVLERGRKALVIYGQMHAQRKQAFSNYDMTDWRSQTLVSLLESAGAEVFSVWTLFEPRALPPEVATWGAHSLAVVRGTTLGAADFASYTAIPNRFDVRAGRPVPATSWRVLPLEEQFDAVLHLGPAAASDPVAPPSALCEDSGFLTSRIARIRLVGLPEVEVTQLTEACAARSPQGR